MDPEPARRTPTQPTPKMGGAPSVLRRAFAVAANSALPVPMELHLTSPGFSLHGVGYPGVPVLFDDQMCIKQPFFDYFLDRCVAAGSVRDPETKRAYGRALYDFLSCMEAHEVRWDQADLPGQIHPIALYRDWSLAAGHLCESTLRNRLSKVIDFYRWAVQWGIIPTHGLFNRSPASIIRGNSRSRYRKPCDGFGRINISMKIGNSPKFLSHEQFSQLISNESRKSYRLIYKLGVLCGLRSCEIRSFPTKYVVDPGAYPGKTIFRVPLSPSDMHIKFNKARSIDIPRTLMTELWTYRLLGRPTCERAQDSECLLITQFGNRFSPSAMQYVFEVASIRCGFHVTPHMLRHTYATHMLKALRDLGIKEQALFYVKNRLGHSSIKHTEIYLHLLDDLDVHLSDAFAASIDEILRGIHG